MKNHYWRGNNFTNDCLVSNTKSSYCRKSNLDEVQYFEVLEETRKSHFDGNELAQWVDH